MGVQKLQVPGGEVKRYLEVVVGVEFDAILVPGDAGAGVAARRADEDDLAAQHVLQLVVRGLHHPRRL